MGHTVWSQRIAAEVILNELNDYGKALREDDRLIYQSVLKRSWKHVGAVSYANSIHVWAFLLISIILEQEKKVRELEAKYESLADGRLQERELDNLVAQNPG